MCLGTTLSKRALTNAALSRELDAIIATSIFTGISTSPLITISFVLLCRPFAGEAQHA